MNRARAEFDGNIRKRMQDDRHVVNASERQNILGELFVGGFIQIFFAQNHGSRMQMHDIAELRQKVTRYKMPVCHADERKMPEIGLAARKRRIQSVIRHRDNR